MTTRRREPHKEKGTMKKRKEKLMSSIFIIHINARGMLREKRTNKKEQKKKRKEGERETRDRNKNKKGTRELKVLTSS